VIHFLLCSFSLFRFKLSALQDENKTNGIDFAKVNERVLGYFGKSNEK
jgi:hypothetical protein